MCTSNDPFVMTKPDSPREMRGKNFSPQKRGKFDFLFLDCCAFVHAGLGFDDDIAPCASIALIDSDDGGSSLSDDSFTTFTKADLSTVFEDIVTVDASFEKNELPKNEDDSKIESTIFTVSTLTMEKIVGMNTVLQTKEEDEERPSKLTLLSENLVTGENYPEDEEWSKTFNTLSTARLPPSLDTKTAEITPSLDTKTLDKTLEGLKLVGTTVGETTEENTGRNVRNHTYAQPLNFYDIDRVPSMVDASEKDDQSVVSGMSFEEYAALVGKDKETGAKSPKSPIAMRLLKAKGKILRPWSRKNRKAANDDDEIVVASELREPFVGTVPITNGQPTSRTEPSKSSVTLMKSSLPAFVPKPTSSPQRLPKRPIDSYRLTVPVIKLTKSNDITASTVGTDEDDHHHGNDRYGDDVPFDEPHACSPRILRVGQYLRPSSNLEVEEAEI